MPVATEATTHEAPARRGRPLARRATALTPDEVVAEARLLLAERGEDGFSMRRLAERLHVSPMTIYQHFSGRDAVLGAVARDSLSKLELPAREGPWVDQGVALAVALRDRVRATASAAALLRSGEDLPLTVVRVADHGLWLMEQAGYRGPEAVAAFRTLFWHALAAALADDAIRGVTDSARQAPLDQLGADEVPTYRAHLDELTPVDPDQLFRLSTTRLLEGLAAAAPGRARRARR